MTSEGNTRNRPIKGIFKWWFARTTLEKFLFVAIMILICVIAAFIAVTIQLGIAARDASQPPPDNSTDLLVLNGSRPTRAPPFDFELCATPGCVQAANNLLNAINQTADPCVDFFQFACGQWIHDHPIPDDKSGFFTTSVLEDTISQQLKAELSSNETSPSQAVNSARALYATCMDINKINEARTGPISAMLARFGGWPLLTEGQWDESRATFNRLMADIRGIYGVEPLISMAVTADMSNSTQNIIGFDEPSLVLGSREYYLLPEYESHRTAYKKAMYEIASLILSDSGMPIPSNLNASIENILLTETAIANITLPPEEKQNFTELNNRFTISELYGIVPQLDWLAFVTASAPPDAMDMIRNDTNIIVGSLKYIQRLPAVLQTISPRQLADAVLWRAIEAYDGTLGTTIQNIILDLNRVLSGKKQLQERYKTCNSVASTYLPLAVGAMYVREHFSADDKKEAMDMVSNLREAFRGIVSNLNWMDDATKTYALEKERNIVELIGYPDFVLDPTLLDKEYDGVLVSPNDSFFEQVRQLRLWWQYREFRQLRKPVDRSEYTDTPAVVNAFYEPNKNSITFPAGILQPPFFKGTYPKYINYGAIGSVIGHEITHGFDDMGSQIDKDGNIADWWSESSAMNFAQRKQCMIDQYSNYTVPGTSLRANGQLTLGENIADNGGIKESYEAYRAYVQQHGEESRLPGLLQFTPDQLFFLSFAHFYCGANTPDANTAVTLGDVHSVDSNRVLGVLSNTPQFAAAFQCASGTPYNPNSKCSVW